MLIVGRRGMSGGYYSPEEEAAMGITRPAAAPTSIADAAQAAVRQTIAGDAITVEGSKAPLIPSSWWPWIIGTVLLGAAWYFVEGRRKRGGASSDAPFVG